MGRASILGALEVRQPVGVVTCITSYNNPWANPAGKVAPALAMGNTVVVKAGAAGPAVRLQDGAGAARGRGAAWVW